MPNTKDRIKFIDISRGIAIIFMVITHYKYGFGRDVIFSFHMPLFIIISGMFFSEKYTFKEICEKICKTLLIPYIITMLIGNILIKTLYNINIDLLTTLKQIFYGYPTVYLFDKSSTVDVLWFLPFLACIKILFYILKKLSKNDDTLLAIFCLFFTALGLQLSNLRIYLCWNLDVAFVSIIFYYIGYIIKKYNILELFSKNKLLYIITLIIWALTIGNMELAVRYYSIIGIIGAIAGTFNIFFLSKIIEKSNLLYKIFSWFGKNSIYILCFHHLERKFDNIYALLNMNNILLIITKLLIITICTYILQQSIIGGKNEKLD